MFSLNSQHFLDNLVYKYLIVANFVVCTKNAAGL